MNSINNEINNYPGFTQQLKLNNNELEELKDAINSQWRKKIKETSSQIDEIINNNKINLGNYHKISDQLNHSDLWNKKSRILPKEFYLKFLRSKFFNKLKDIFGTIEISDEDSLGYGNIYWRLVRPNKNEDVGPYHRDSWFWELNKNFPKPNYPFKRIKIWIAIETEIGKSGLLVEKNSHKRKDINWEGQFRHGIRKPILLDNKESFKMTLVETSPGDCIVFNDDLIHGGAINHGSKTRVSTEFTILQKKYDQNK